MAIDASVISKSFFDKPVQPLFNTIYNVLVRAGIPAVITNTNNNLIVSISAKVGSAPQCSDLTDEMFKNATTTISTSGVVILPQQYFTEIDLTCAVTTTPNEMRTDSAGINESAMFEILITIGNQFSTSLLANLYTGLGAMVREVVPAGNIVNEMAGKIEWNPTATPAAGKQGIAAILNDIVAKLPLTMLPGGAAGDIVVAWVSAQDFLTMKNGINSAYQFKDAGGLGTTYFQYVKEASTIDETRNKFRNNRIEFGDIVILPLNGLANDTILVTYQEGLEDARVFYDKVPVSLRDNVYAVIKGAFKDEERLAIPVEDMARGFFDLPYQVGELFAINKVENAQLNYKVIASLAAGLIFKEVDKVFAYLPDAAAAASSLNLETVK